MRQMLLACLPAENRRNGVAESQILCALAAGDSFAPEEYALDVSGQVGAQQITIRAGTEAGLLYGVSDFVSEVVPKARQSHTWMDPYYFRDPWEEGFPVQAFRSAPSVLNRGLWTWGHVIYDYRGYLQNMARLKLNRLVIWNDYPPLNAADIVRCAHGLGIRILWGFAWGWDNHFTLDLSDDAMLKRLADETVERFLRDYADLPGDGLYFQSFTETAQETCHDRVIAQVVVDWVNGVCDRILSLRPGLDLQFGLHATSVRRQMGHIARVDPRVRLVWEDCGAFPYAYLPENMEDAEATRAFTQQMSAARHEGATGAVFKGMICLNWSSFQHRKAPERIGEMTEAQIAARMPAAERVMRLAQSGWMLNGSAMLDAVRQLAGGSRDAELLALMEDGLFERKIWFPAALFAAALWNCTLPFQELLTAAAHRPDTVFANEND